MSAREPISKKLRFEVFKRDAFTCQYCGRKAPDVILEVDHLNPVVEGGTRDILNLITACRDCNSGKGPRQLGDHAVLERQLDQMADLEERRQQLDLLLQWQQELIGLQDETLSKVTAFFEGQVSGSKLTDGGRAILAKHIKRFGAAAVVEAIRIATQQYLILDEDGQPTHASAGEAFGKIGGICHNRAEEARKPYMSDLRRVMYRLRRRGLYEPVDLLVRLENAYARGVTVEAMHACLDTARNWTEFRQWLEDDDG